MTNAPMSFIAAMLHFFGAGADQTKVQFGTEVKNLSDGDKAFFRAGLEANGYNISP